MKKLSLALIATNYMLFAISFMLSAAPALADGSAGSVCTPVYGMANSCAEHLVVDTGLETSTFLNAGVLSYVLGLAAFIKAKRG